MKRLFTLLVFLSVRQLPAQQVHSVPYTILNQLANDMVYDSAMSRLLISVPASDPIYGNKIGYINPDPVFFSHAYAVGSDPGPLAITENCKYLYVGLNGANSIKKFNISSGASTQNFIVGSDPFLGPMHAGNISCQPGTDSVIAVSRKITGFNPVSAGAVIFKNGQLLVNSVVQYSVIIDQVKFQSPTALYAFNNENPDFAFYKLAVNSSGASLEGSTSNLMNGFDSEFYIAGNRAVSDRGNALELSGLVPVSSGTYNLPAAAVHAKACFDPYLNLVCFAYKDAFSDTVVIERFHRDSYLVYDQLKIPGIQHDVTRLITWGDSTNYAFCTNGPQLVITGKRKLVTGVAPLTADENFSMYPNPVQDELFFNYAGSVIIELLNATGNTILSTSEKNIHVAQLPRGLYIIRATDLSGRLVATRKVIRD